MLQRLHDEVPANHFTLGWLTNSLRKRSFGIIMLLLALVAIAPGLSIVAGLLLMIPAFQMIAGKPAPVFPRRIATRSLPTKHLATVVQRSVPVLRYLERVVHPRWHTPLEATKRLVGAIVVVLSACSRSPCWPPPLCWRSRRQQFGRWSSAQNGSSLFGSALVATCSLVTNRAMLLVGRANNTRVAYGTVARKNACRREKPFLWIDVVIPATEPGDWQLLEKPLGVMPGRLFLLALEANMPGMINLSSPMTSRLRWRVRN
ncbi:exopolysaccharide biosynthesis protein [Bradyrhizobium japonicum]|uniref:exopolysaccharide biosynthesis protein n=1 Tax=Bradyrhizobium japonicum TaxID=375 RepID=UPI003B66E801